MPVLGENIAVNPDFENGTNGWTKEPLDATFGYPHRLACWSIGLSAPLVSGQRRLLSSSPHAPAVRHQGPGPVNIDTAAAYTGAAFPINFTGVCPLAFLDVTQPPLDPAYRGLQMGATPSESKLLGMSYVHNGEGFEVGYREKWRVTIPLWRDDATGFLQFPTPTSYRSSMFDSVPENDPCGGDLYAIDWREDWNMRWLHAKSPSGGGEDFGKDAGGGVGQAPINYRRNFHLMMSSPELSSLQRYDGLTFPGGVFWIDQFANFGDDEDVDLGDDHPTPEVIVEFFAPTILWDGPGAPLGTGEKIHVFLSLVLNGSFSDWTDLLSQIGSAMVNFNADMADPGMDPRIQTVLEGSCYGYGAEWGVRPGWSVKYMGQLPTPPPPPPPGSEPPPCADEAIDYPGHKSFPSISLARTGLAVLAAGAKGAAMPPGCDFISYFFGPPCDCGLAPDWPFPLLMEYLSTVLDYSTVCVPFVQVPFSGDLCLRGDRDLAVDLGLAVVEEGEYEIEWGNSGTTLNVALNPAACPEPNFYLYTLYYRALVGQTSGGRTGYWSGIYAGPGVAPWTNCAECPGNTPPPCEQCPDGSLPPCEGGVPPDTFDIQHKLRVGAAPAGDPTGADSSSADVHADGIRVRVSPDPAGDPTGSDTSNDDRDVHLHIRVRP